ncbi:hypothetical protein ACTXO0_07735 [Glutamicibacter ardleyensis]|uniref:hypothetical protein n=1 Tax=Glutamicibacter ardleyensis TaxID=225894 RepID=UPI003FD06766
MKNRIDIQDRSKAILPWVYDSNTGCLVFQDNGYEVPLLEMTDSARVLDWVIQISKKVWADDAVIAGLVVGIDRFLNLQGTLCSAGVSKKISNNEIRVVLGFPQKGEH